MSNVDRSNKFWFRNDPSLRPGYQRCFECSGIFLNEYEPPRVAKPPEPFETGGEGRSGSRRAVREPFEWELQQRAQEARLREREEAKRQEELDRIERAKERAYASLADAFKYRPKRCKCGGRTKPKPDATHETSEPSDTPKNQVQNPQPLQEETINQNLESDRQVNIAGDNTGIINLGDNVKAITSNTSRDRESNNRTISVNKGEVTVTVNGVAIGNPESSITVEKRGNISVSRTNRSHDPSSVATQLQQINDLYLAGALNAEQFETAKNKILGL